MMREDMERLLYGSAIRWDLAGLMLDSIEQLINQIVANSHGHACLQSQSEPTEVPRG
jgi:hypothetical protein